MEPPEVLGLTLKLIYHEALDEDSVPAAGDYTVTAANGAVTTTLPVTAVGVKGNTVTLTLARAPGVSQMVTLRYTAPASNPVRDLAVNDAEGLTESRKVKSVPTVSVGAVYPAVTPGLGDPEFRVTVSQAPESDLEVALSFEQTEEYLPETTATITVPAGRTSANRAFGISSPHSRGSGSLTATVTGATLGRRHRRRVRGGAGAGQRGDGAGAGRRARRRLGDADVQAHEPGGRRASPTTRRWARSATPARSRRPGSRASGARWRSRCWTRSRGGCAGRRRPGSR